MQFPSINFIMYIQDITRTQNGNIMVSSQWFYTLSEIFIGKNMESFDTRELFYCFHKDNVHTETIMHKCKIQFITEKSHISRRKNYPDFIVQKAKQKLYCKLQISYMWLCMCL